MSSNLESAKAAIEAELAHAKQGLAHFVARIEALEKTISHLLNVDGRILAEQNTKPGPTARLVKAPKVKVSIADKAAKPTKASKGSKELPFTGGDFWINLVAVEPKSASEVLDAGIKKLGIKPTKEQRNKLAGRLTFAINALVKSGKIKDSGSGRDRRFFKE